MRLAPLRTDPPPPPRRHARLRTRIVVRVGLLVALLSLVLGAGTYATVRSALISERDRSTVDQFSTNALVLAAALRTDDIDEVELLTSLRPEVRARELLFADGEWFTASLQVQPDDLPPTLVDQVRSGQASRQRFLVDGSLVLALGTPLADGDLYFEVFSLDDIRSTLDELRNALVIVGSLATLGGMAVAAWIGRRIAQPLERISRAAAGIAEGALDTRLDDHADAEVARIAESFNRMADALQQRIERETRFAADVSHELRSPLTTLVNTVSVLQNRRAELSAEAAEALALLAADVERFERMVEDLIEISKHDGGSIRLDLEEISPVAAVQGALRRLGRADLPVAVDAGLDDALVAIDRQRFGVVMRNLIDNADAYAGGATRVAIAGDEHAIRVAVDDHGPGVHRNERERVFERFSRGTQGERRSTVDGSGLGLALVRENVNRLGGHIEVVDNPDGVGARFALTLPRVR